MEHAQIYHATHTTTTSCSDTDDIANTDMHERRQVGDTFTTENITKSIKEEVTKTYT